MRTASDTLVILRDLAARMPDHLIAVELARQGLLSRHGKPWTRNRVFSMRHRHGIPTACPADTGGVVTRADGLIPARVAAERLGVSLAAIRIWAHQGIVACDQSKGGAKLWIKLGTDDFERLSGRADTAGMERARDLADRAGCSIAAVWDRVRRGEFTAYRVQRGCGQWDWRLTPPPTIDAGPPPSRLQNDRKRAA